MPVKDASGRFVSVMNVVVDLTEARVKAMEDEARLAALSRVQGVAEFKPNSEIINANDNSSR